MKWPRLPRVARIIILPATTGGIHLSKRFRFRYENPRRRDNLVIPRNRRRRLSTRARRKKSVGRSTVIYRFAGDNGHD